MTLEKLHDKVAIIMDNNVDINELLELLTRRELRTISGYLHLRIVNFRKLHKNSIIDSIIHHVHHYQITRAHFMDTVRIATQANLLQNIRDLEYDEFLIDNIRNRIDDGVFCKFRSISDDYDYNGGYDQFYMKVTRVTKKYIYGVRCRTELIKRGDNDVVRLRAFPYVWDGENDFFYDAYHNELKMKISDFKECDSLSNGEHFDYDIR